MQISKLSDTSDTKQVEADSFDLVGGEPAFTDAIHWREDNQVAAITHDRVFIMVKARNMRHSQFLSNSRIFLKWLFTLE